MGACSVIHILLREFLSDHPLKLLQHALLRTRPIRRWNRRVCLLVKRLALARCLRVVAHQLIGESLYPLLSLPRQVCSMDLEHVACRDLRDEVRCLGRDAERRINAGLLANRLSGGRLGQHHGDRLLAQFACRPSIGFNDQIDRLYLLN